MHELVQDYYGKQLTSSAVLKTCACCDLGQQPEWLKPFLGRLRSVLLNFWFCAGCQRAGQSPAAIVGFLFPVTVDR
jgi:arsenite methyltransferase